MQEEPKQSTPKKPWIYYYLIAMLAVMLFNALVAPGLLQRRVIEVGYDEFLSMVDAGKVTEVAREEDQEQLVFSAADTSGKEQIYKTG
ncbi:MAG: cell division protein FtsH, partial [Oscillospiraceae bacterium]